MLVRTLTGQMFPPDHMFRQMALHGIWTGKVNLARDQPKVQLRREHDRSLRAVGTLVHVQDDDVDGTWCVFSIDDPTFRELDERCYLSAGFSRDFATSAVGTCVHYDDVILAEVSLVERPGCWENAPVQLDACDPRDGKGGHSRTTTPYPRRVLDRAHDHYRSHPWMRRADFVRTLDPANPSPVIRKPVDPLRQPNLARAMAMIAGGSSTTVDADRSRPSAATMKRQSDLGISPMWTDKAGLVHHVRTNSGRILKVT